MKKLHLIYKLTAISIATISPCAYAQKAKGLTFTDDKKYENIGLASSASRGSLPNKIDLRHFFPKPGNQGQQPSCVGWATGYALKTYQESVERKWRPDSPSRIFSPSFIYNQIKLPTGGSRISDALDVLLKQGTVSLNDFPYDPNNANRIPDNSIKQKATPFRIAAKRRLSSKNLVNETRGHLAENFPIVIGATVGESFERHKGRRNYTLNHQELGSGHAMVTIGYDDTKKAFLVINSWGSSWGDNGYGWISYDTYARIVTRSYVVQDIVIADTGGPDVDPSNITNVKPNVAPPVIPSGNLRAPIFQHNQRVNIPGGQALGMAIKPMGQILNARGKKGQVIIRFYQPTGQPLKAHANDFIFRDQNGQVAAGSSEFIIDNNSFDLSRANFYLPYGSLNFQPTNGQRVNRVSMLVHLYVDGFEISRSQRTDFFFRW